MLQEKVVLTHVKNKKMRGYLFSESFLPVTDEAGNMTMQARIGVLWQDVRTPAISYHVPEELIWLELEAVSTDQVEYEDDDSDDVDSDEMAAGFDEELTEASV